MKVARLGVDLLCVAIAAAVGYGVSRAAGTGAPRSVRFAFSQTELSTRQGSDIAGSENESFPVVTCQWPDGKTSITVYSARRVTCFPQGTHPITTGRSWLLLDSPIGGAKYPVQNGHLSDDIRFVHASTKPEVMSVSPVLMQFGDYSGGARPSIIISRNSVWIYDYWTENGPEVLRISTTTGAILQRTVMPAISRPVCAVNRYGFWMGQAGNSFYGKGVTLGVWYAPIGATHGVLLRRTNDFVWGIAAVGTSVDVEVSPQGYSSSTQKEYLWRFSAEPASTSSSSSIASRINRVTPTLSEQKVF